jgi:hypothetical protein
MLRVLCKGARDDFVATAACDADHGIPWAANAIEAVPSEIP